jgi:tetratricopeptide (TPR) repeat protein
MDEVGRRAARLLEETQAGKAEEVLRHVETVLREPTGDLAGGPAPMHFVRVVSLIMLDQVRACLEATELMLRAAERDGSVGWRACALATRASEGLRLGDLDIAEHDVDAALRDLIAAEALLALGDGDRIASVNARVGVGMGYRMLRLYELAGPQYQAAYELSAADGSGEGNAAMWLTNLAQLHLEWALELYQVNDVAGAEAHTARAEAYAMRAAVEAAGPDAGTWRAQALLAAACSRADRDEPAGAAVDIAHHLKVLETGGISAREVAYAQPFHAVALKRSGRPEEALRVMAAAVDNLPPDAEWLAAAATRRTYAVLLAAQGSTDAQAALAYGDTLAGALWRQRLRTLQTAETLKSYESLRIRHEEAARAAETDPLTGTANRRGFDREVNRLRTDAESAGRAATVLIIDMDKLKPGGTGPATRPSGRWRRCCGPTPATSTRWPGSVATSSAWCCRARGGRPARRSPSASSRRSATSRTAWPRSASGWHPARTTRWRRRSAGPTRRCTWRSAPAATRSAAPHAAPGRPRCSPTGDPR